MNLQRVSLIDGKRNIYKDMLFEAQHAGNTHITSGNGIFKDWVPRNILAVEKET